MQFLPDVYVPCEVCKGQRYNREALEIHYKGRSIADVLEMTIEEALEFFEPGAGDQAKLQTLNDVGLGYVHLGQPATTLSGGEAQRVKLATELSKRATGRTLYVLDEPTTGPPLRRRRRSSSRSSIASSTAATPSSSSSTTSTSSRPPTGSSTSGPRAGSAAARSSPPGRPRRSRRSAGSATGEYLARVLRGEPLIPLSDVTFAEEAGRGGRNGDGDGRARRRLPIAPSRKRAAAPPAEAMTAGRRCPTTDRTPARHEIPAIDEAALEAARLADRLLAAARDVGVERWVVVPRALPGTAARRRAGRAAQDRPARRGRPSDRRTRSGTRSRTT